ncbi:MAG: B12-binding domain-containing radical SAM protein [Alphaproteobacteria bacterium]|nr:B12-binding domain-containing radical SAM protein [Alphaproteobacteria bacterium]
MTAVATALKTDDAQALAPAALPWATLIVPPVVCHNLDPHTGIPFMPHMAAHLAGTLKHHGKRNVQVIDCFGLQPNNTQVVGEFLLMGVDEAWVSKHIHPQSAHCFIYCRTIAEFIAVERLIHRIRQDHPHIAITLFENVQAVTSYSLRHVAKEFIGKGADCILMGEPEDRVIEVAAKLETKQPLDGILGVAYRRGDEVVVSAPSKLPAELDAMAMPAWENFPLRGYWQAGFAHAPVERGTKFLPILTSRGCPYRCTFCIAPEVNPTWRARSAKNVVDEMEHFYRTLGVTDYHVSDLDPTVNDKRTKEICNELIARNLPITWKLAQGTKIETIKSEETLELMKKAGCVFVSFSPESGSSKLLKIMNKPFDHEHALRMAKKMASLGIKMQAVFIGGVPGEEPDDRDMSVAYAKRLIEAGVDEVSLVIFTPLPGAKLSSAINDFSHYSQCTPSPAWRKDYKILTAYRMRMYTNLLVCKARYHPDKLVAEVFRLVTLRFKTKMEMSLFKQAKLYALRYAPWIFPKLDAEAELKNVA